MKKILFFLLGIILCFSMCGCVTEPTSKNEHSEECQRFELVDGSYGLTAVVVDTETGVEYLWMHHGYAGGLTVLVDREGNPLIFKE